MFFSRLPQATTSAFFITGWMLTVFLYVAPTTFADDVELDSCIMTDPTDCPLSNLTSSTVIYPGNHTRCYSDTTENGDENPYFFQVIPGSKDLIIYFQGGGSCNNAEQCERGGARRSPEPIGKQGIFDDRGMNPFAGWTAVNILYCSGDLHLGDGVDGDTYFNGRQNVLAVLDWMTLNIMEAPERVIVLGTSAGSAAVHVWANRMLQFTAMFDPEPVATVIMDSTLILDSGDEQAQADPNETNAWNVCSEEALVDLGYENDGVLCVEPTSPVDFQMITQATYPDTPFLVVLSKQDPIGVKNFCQANDGIFCSQSNFYEGVKDRLLAYHEARGNDNNVLSYFINRQLHVVTTNDFLFFPASMNDFLTCPSGWFQTRLITWLKEVVLRGDTYSISSQCSPWFSLFPPWPFTNLGCKLSVSLASFNS